MTGATNIVSVPFPYLSKLDVYVSVDGIEQARTSYTWASVATIQLGQSAASLSGKTVTVERRTASDEPAATFASSGIDYRDLNKTTLQGLYLDQEQLNRADEAEGRVEALEEIANTIGALDPGSALITATQAEAEAGVVHNRVMTPLRSKQQFDAKFPAAFDARFASQNIGPQTKAALNEPLRADGKGLFWDNTAGKYIHAWASPADRVIDLRDLMDARYGVGAWTKRTGVAAGSDIGPAITDGLDKLRAKYGRGKIIVPPGSWLLSTGLDPAKLAGMVVEGDHELASIIVAANTTSSVLASSGAGGYTGGAWRRLGLMREDGYSAVCTAMLLQGDATSQPDQFSIEDIYCTAIGTGFWSHGLNINGIARTSPQGVRVFNGRNIQIFKCGSGGGVGAGFYNVVQGHVQNLGVYAGTGSYGNNVYIGGGGAALTNTIQFSLERLACSGELNLTNSTRLFLDGFCATLTGAPTADLLWGWLDIGSLVGSIGANSNLITR